MTTRHAACDCGQLRLEADGEPVAVSICHCLACQRRTGSAFGLQAGYRAEQVRTEGRYTEYSRVSDEEDRQEHNFAFCPECGSTVFGTEPEASEEFVVVFVGAFADPTFPPPTESGYESRRHPWVGLPDGIERLDDWRPIWASVHPLYEAGQYAEAAQRGRELLETHPETAGVLYNVACCESLAGQTLDAIEHLGRAIGLAERCRSMAKGDADFDPIRDEPAFRELVGK
jgi:hypothetical protein